MRALQPRRRGFTLVELLVVIGIILVLAGLALLVANSGIIGNARTSSGSDRIGGWFMQARAKAQRTTYATGLRLSPPINGFIREAQLIEVPEPFIMASTNRLMIEQSPAGKKAYVVGPDAAQVALSVVTNDTLSITETRTIHRVLGIGATTTVTFGSGPGATTLPAVEIVVVNSNLLPDIGAAALTVAPAPPGTAQPTYNAGNFGFIRQARPTFGEPPLLLPESVAIDVANSQLPLANADGSFDIVFSPNGEVQNTNGLGQVILWTRNPEAFAGNPRTANGGGDRPSYEQAGEMRLIVVYSKTGAVAVQMVATPVGAGPNPTHDPFANAKDGIASGL